MLGSVATLTASAGVPAVTAAADEPGGFLAPGSPFSSASTAFTATNFGPPLNPGMNCGSALEPRPCWIGHLKIGLAPGWEDPRTRVAIIAAIAGRLSLAHNCPADAVGRTDTGVFFGGGASKVGPGFFHQVGCAWNDRYTIPSERVTWRFEWNIPSRGGWVVAGKQQDAEQVFADQHPGLDPDAYVGAALASGVELPRICEPFLFVPSTPRLSSVPREYQACTALVASGKFTARAVMAAIGVTFGLVALDVMVGPNRPTPLSPRTIAPTVRPPLPVPIVGDPFGSPLPTAPNDPITQAIATANPALSAGDAAAIAMRCRHLVVAARLDSILTNGTLRHPCEGLPIFIPGADVYEAADHKLKSLLAFPERVLLHNASTDMTELRLIAEGYMLAGYDFWRPKVPHDSIAYTSILEAPCFVSATSDHCDEYPYASSLEGGPGGDPSDPATWIGFALSNISATDNEREGQLLSQFKTDSGCGLTELGSAGSTIVGVPFLVVPLPTGVETTYICQGS